MSDKQRFGGIDRLYGGGVTELLAKQHVIVAGIGGVGTWAVEALARSGVGKLTLIDLDEVCETNINRQLHALENTIGESKIDLMADRIALINPDCEVELVHDFITPHNLEAVIDLKADLMLDAIDAAMVKAGLIAYCKRNKLPIITVGSAGGKSDPRLITSGDLSKTINDPLAAKVRGTLRNRFNFSRNLTRRFGVECIYSTEQIAYPKPDGSVNGKKYLPEGITKMDCSAGFGASTMVTGTFGFIAASRAIEKLIARASLANE